MSAEKTKVTVAKFGGSSMSDAIAISRSAKVAFNHKANIVVVSATYGTTNLLIKLIDLAVSGPWNECQEILSDIEDRHLKMASDLEASPQMIEQMAEVFRELETITKGVNLLKDCSLKARDGILSVGERISSPLMTTALKELYLEKEVELFDIRKVIKTDDNFGAATPDFEQIKTNSDKFLIGAKYGDVVYVTQGFIGSNENGSTTTLGRGGSDYSAALIAEGMGADLLEIWTDVAGIATTDPRICEGTRPINEITFQEAAEMATMGAKILHPTTLTPVKRAGIPVFVGSSLEPDAPGTWIKETSTEAPLVRALAIRSDQSLLTLSTPDMLQQHGFLYKIFEIFNRYKISVDSITTSEISVALTIEDSTLLNKKLLTELENFASVTVEEDLTLVSVIGNHINHTAGIAQKLFNALQGDDSKINVRMICHGASKHNFCFLVHEDDATMAVRRLHKEFIG